jgi:hypothetical protein
MFLLALNLAQRNTNVRGISPDISSPSLHPYSISAYIRGPGGGGEQKGGMGIETGSDPMAVLTGLDGFKVAKATNINIP